MDDLTFVPGRVMGAFHLWVQGFELSRWLWQVCRKESIQVAIACNFNLSPRLQGRLLTAARVSIPSPKQQTPGLTLSLSWW